MHWRVTTTDNRNRIIDHQRYVQSRSDDAVVVRNNDRIWLHARDVCFSYSEWFVNPGTEVRLDAHAC
jgi:hypothetical protein